MPVLLPHYGTLVAARGSSGNRWKSLITVRGSCGDGD
jgi:hypothetical protein